MEPRRRLSALALFVTTILAATTASAAEYRPFTHKDFAAAQADGRSIVVDVSATWCPTCKAQEAVLNQLVSGPRFDKLIVFRLEFDAQKADWRALKVWRQSTLIAFRGKRETSRAVAETDPAGLQRLLDTAVQ